MESEPESIPTPAKTCQYCNKMLHGRSDQRYCNDDCRNTYNRLKRKAEKIADHKNTPEIFRAIGRNYELLKSLKPPKQPNAFTSLEDKNELLQQGFNPKFFTSIYNDGQQTWHCIFEYGFTIGEKLMIIGWFPQQANL